MYEAPRIWSLSSGYIQLPWLPVSAENSEFSFLWAHRVEQFAMHLLRETTSISEHVRAEVEDVFFGQRQWRLTKTVRQRGVSVILAPPFTNVRSYLFTRSFAPKALYVRGFSCWELWPFRSLLIFGRININHTNACGRYFQFVFAISKLVRRASLC